jgi:hypothetical protein
LEAFLPQIKAANESLFQSIKETEAKLQPNSNMPTPKNPYDIEVVEENKPYIEMVGSHFIQFNCLPFCLSESRIRGT